MKGSTTAEKNSCRTSLEFLTAQMTDSEGLKKKKRNVGKMKRGKIFQRKMLMSKRI